MIFGMRKFRYLLKLQLIDITIFSHPLLQPKLFPNAILTICEVEKNNK